MRWAVPWFMLAAIVSNFLIYNEHIFYTISLWLQVLGYLIVFLTWKLPRLQTLTLAKLVFFFVQVNIAIAHSTIYFLRGKRMVTWTPSQR